MIDTTISIDQIDPLPENYNDHPADQIVALQDSVGMFGQVKPVVVWPRPDVAGRFFCLAGHGVLAGLRLAGVDQVRASVVPDDWDRALALAYAAADNETARLSRPDRDRLAHLLARVHAEAPAAVDVVGLDQAEVDRLLALARETARNGAQAPLPGLEEAEEAEEAGLDQAAARARILERWRPEAGQVWRLGAHCLVIGDCTAASSWEAGLAVLEAESVGGVVTSPPYADRRRADYGGVPAADYPAWWLQEVQPALDRFVAPAGSVFLNLAPHVEDGLRLTYDWEIVLDLARRSPAWFRFESFVWRKTAYPGQVAARLKNGWEPVHQIVRQVPPAANLDRLRAIRDRWEDGRGFRASRRPLARSQGKGESGSAARLQDLGAYPDNVIVAPPDSTGIYGEDHPARFPVKLADFFIRGWGVDGRPWADPFSGSGSTLIAGQRLGVPVLAIEKIPDYGAFILERYAAEVGNLPDRLPELVEVNRGQE